MRFPNLGQASFWWDECLTARLVRDVHDASPFVVLSALSRGLSTYFVLLAPWSGSDSAEWALRVPSVLAGIALVPVLVLAGREIGGRALGWRLGLLAAISPWMVWHSREARWYALTVLFVAVGFVCFFRLLRGWRWGWAIGWFVAGLAAASTYSPAITLLILQTGWFCASGPAREALRRQWHRSAGGGRTIQATIAALLFLLAAGWTARTLVIPAVTGGAKGFDFRNLGGPQLGAVAYTGIAQATGYTIGPGPSEWHVIDRIGLPAIDAVLLIAGTVAYLVLMVIGARRIATLRGRSFSAALIVLVIVPLALVVAASWWTDHSYAPRYAAFTYPVSLTLAAAGLQGTLMRRTALAAGAVLLGLQALSLWNLHFEPRYQREDLRAAARYVAARESPEDQILLLGGLRVPWEYYYAGTADWEIVRAAGAGAWTEKRLREVIASRPAVWVVQGRMWEEPGAAELASLMAAWDPPLESRRFAGGVLVSHHRGGRVGRRGGLGVNIISGTGRWRTVPRYHRDRSCVSAADAWSGRGRAFRLSHCGVTLEDDHD